MKSRTFKYLVGDFETTVYEGQTSTDVWASAIVELNTEDVHIFHSLPETFEYIVSLNSNVCIYYHNLKFDGSFWLSYLMLDLKLQQAITHHSEKEDDVKFDETKDMLLVRDGDTDLDVFTALAFDSGIDKLYISRSRFAKDIKIVTA